jgi:hypothetical protein
VAIQPKGVLSRSIWDWAPSQIMAGYAIVNATGGQHAYVAIFNDNTQGQYLWVIDCSITGSNNTDCIFEILDSNPGGTPVAFPPVPIVGNVGATSGQLQTFYSVACIGNHLGAATNVTQTPYSWPHAWPIAIIPPGKAMGFQTSIVAASLNVGCYWWVGPQP